MKPLLCALVCGVACAATPVLLDTDIGTDIDDAFALALAIASPELDLRGVTTVSADAYGRALIACRFLEAAGKSGVPVSPGRPRRATPERRGQYEYGAGAFAKRPLAQLAAEFLFERLKAEPGRLTIITIGDLTNVARLLTDHPEAKPWIQRIVIMGGSVRAGYNRKPPAVWEWNIRSDIPAAQTVFNSGVPLTVAPLDATVVKLEKTGRERIFAGNALGRELQELYRLWGKETPTLFDPVAVTLSFRESFFKMENLRLRVDPDGFTREAAGEPNARTATAIDQDGFLEWYVGRIGNYRSAAKFTSPRRLRVHRSIPLEMPATGFAPSGARGNYEPFDVGLLRR
jgi:inosine-uridine nucleoside N-ribohydrolase